MKDTLKIRSRQIKEGKFKVEGFTVYAATMTAAIREWYMCYVDIEYKISV